jgi:hypothetical protein
MTEIGSSPDKRGFVTTRRWEERVEMTAVPVRCPFYGGQCTPVEFCPTLCTNSKWRPAEHQLALDMTGGKVTE